MDELTELGRACSDEAVTNGRLELPVRWLRSYWDEEDVTYFFEADEDGWVLRQIELRGPDKTPAVASALSEWTNADRDGLGAVQAYEATYGALADKPITEWDAGFPHVEIGQPEFGDTWERARAYLERSK